MKYLCLFFTVYLSLFHFNSLESATLDNSTLTRIEPTTLPIEPTKVLNKKPYSLSQKKNSPKRAQIKTTNNELNDTLFVFALFPLLGFIFGLIFAQPTLIITATIFIGLILLFLIVALPLSLLNKKLKGLMKLLLLIGISSISVVFLLVSFILLIVGLCIGNIAIWAVSGGILALASLMLLFINIKK